MNLMALGAGFGQGMQQIQQQREVAMRDQMARILLQNQQRQQLAQSLVGDVLTAGGIPGMGSLGNMRAQGLPGMQPAMAGQGAPPAMGTAQPMMAPQPMSSPNNIVSGGYMFSPGGTQVLREPGGLMPPAEGESMTPAPGSYPIPLDEDEPTVPQEAAAAQRTGTEPSDAAIARSNAPPAPAGAPDPASAPAMQAQDDQGVSLQEAPNYLSMFRQIDPQAIAQRIKQVRPDAPSDAIAAATESLYKMAQGGAREQIAAASMMKYLVGEQGRNQRFAATQGLREQREDRLGQAQTATQDYRNRSLDQRGALGQGNIDARNRATDVRQSEGDKNRQAAQSRQSQRLDAQRYQRALSRAEGQTKSQLSELHRQIAEFDRRIQQMMLSTDQSSAARTELDRTLKARQALFERENKMAEPLLGGQQ